MWLLQVNCQKLRATITAAHLLNLLYCDQLHPILINVCVEVDLCGCLARACCCVAIAIPGCAEASHLHKQDSMDYTPHWLKTKMFGTEVRKIGKTTGAHLFATEIYMCTFLKRASAAGCSQVQA